MKQLRSKCGIFTTDDDGLLVSFENHEWDRFNPLYARLNEVFSFEVPEGVRWIAAGLFDGYDFERAVLPASLEGLGDGQQCAFRYSTIRELTMPGHVRLSRRAFFGCQLHQISFSSPPEAQLLRALGCALHGASVKKGFSDSLSADARAVFTEAYSAPLGSRVLRNESGVFTVDDLDVLRSAVIAGQPAPAFSDRDSHISVDELILPEGIAAVPDRALCHLEVRRRLSLPASLRMIGGQWWKDGELDFGIMNADAFARCDLPEVVLPAKLRVLGNYAFAQSRLKRVTVPPGFEINHGMTGFGRQFKESSVEELRIAADCVEASFLSQKTGGQWETEWDPDFGEMFSFHYADTYRNGERIGALLQHIRHQQKQV